MLGVQLDSLREKWPIEPRSRSGGGSLKPEWQCPAPTRNPQAISAQTRKPGKSIEVLARGVPDLDWGRGFVELNPVWAIAEVLDAW
jgi:hypothetical protein